ncbi:MAG: peptidylprolyl isomerase [Candidatus Eisenbacteria bacterium]
MSISRALTRFLALAAIGVLAFGCGGEKKGDSVGAVHDTGQELVGDPDAELAVVGGQSIRLSEVDLVSTFWTQSSSAEAQQAENRKALQLRALEHLIDQLVLAQEAQRRSIEADEAVVGKMLAEWERQFPNEEDRQAKLAARHVTYEEIREKFRQDVLVQALVNEIIRDTLQVDPREIQAYYDEHPTYFDTTEVHARHVLIAVGPAAPPESIAAAQELADRVCAEARAGADFAELAARYSDCPSKGQGGDLGYFRRAQMVPTFSETAFALAPGAISDPVRTEFGFHVIQVQDRRGGGIQPFAMAQPMIHRFLYGQKLQGAVDVLAADLREKARVTMKVPS